ncbi:hypothetical protein SARC_15672 [Sphaeroforma arctica JP610]|uniref:Protein kinase domain-containing protein n=1 Tax=Sphaeroforma arctica JP610 TaxID=667725 RepID=A0A0L0F5D2_9EUKA|nr:hypothetical protein SARC_15672 [Sphaeroforma arctica JP610]KNC71781.1 hypothetical protein SARC_15672 [Sphaeroforma arctica JP610]|eukprot:XP_014145683.1 hypothetical protein SARC_15672 [Sphaeroforma arctica JP610]
MFKKFSKAVAAAANQAAVTYTSGTIEKDYVIGKQTASGGHCCLWRIHSATNKQHKIVVSVFIFDKQTLNKYPVQDREVVLKMLRRDVSQVSKSSYKKCIVIVR